MSWAKTDSSFPTCGFVDLVQVLARLLNRADARWKPNCAVKSLTLFLQHTINYKNRSTFMRGPLGFIFNPFLANQGR